MKSQAMLLLLCFLAARNARSQVWLEGDSDCGEWVTARKENRSMALEHFALGFLNGLSSGTQYEFWRATGAKTSRVAVYLWIDNYCQSNPLDPLVTAVIKLFDERSGRRLVR